MFFQSVHEPRGISVDLRSLPQKFTVQGSRGNQVTVTLQVNDLPPVTGEDEPHPLQCRALAEFEPGRKLSEDFRELAAGRLPADSDPTVSQDTLPRLTEHGELADPSEAPYAVMPPRLRAFVVAIRTELAEAALRTIGLLRWRTADEGPYDAIRTRGAFWSLDGHSWHHLPTAIEVRATALLVPQISQTIHDDVQALLDTGAEEPLAHRLWREAWQLRGDNSRSALLIGMTALEVGVKNYIAHAVPNTDWLLEHLPAPPTHRLLGDYIPTLPARDGVAPVITPDVRAAMRVAQERRNALAHTGEVLVENEWLDTTLRQIRNILWTLDAGRGFSWAPTAELLRVPGGLADGDGTGSATTCAESER
jgi:hypothetical protein